MSQSLATGARLLMKWVVAATFLQGMGVWAGSPANLVTLTASSITSSGATLNGTINPQGASGEAFFEWGTDPSFKTYHLTTPQPVGSNNNTQNFSVPINDAPSGEVVFFRIGFQDVTKGAYVFGGGNSFTVGSATLITNPPTNVGSSSAVLNGSVNPQGSGGEAFFQWGTDPSFATARQSSPAPVFPGSGLQNFSVPIGDLPSGTVIFFRIVFYDSNNGVHQYGMPSSFMVGTATLMTNPPTMVGSASAVLNGSVNPQGAAGWVFFEYGTDPSFAVCTRTLSEPATPGNTLQNYSVPVGHLPSGTLIFYRVAFHNADNSSFEYGTSNSFMVGNAMLMTNPPTNVGSSSAVLNGSVNPQGSSGNVFFQWGTDPSFRVAIKTVSQPVTPDWTLENVSIPVGHLQSGLMVFYRIGFFDTSNGSYQYSASGSFMVGNAQMMADPPTAVGASSATLNGSVNPQGSSGRVYFQYGYDPSFKSAVVTPLEPIAPSSVMQNFSVPVTGLKSGSLVFYRIVFHDDDNQNFTYSGSNSFLVGTPTLFTAPVSNVVSGGATLNGSVNSLGSNGQVAFQWGTDPTFHTYNRTIWQPIAGSEILQNFSVPITGVPKGAIVFFRIAFLDTGNNLYFYGGGSSFNGE